MTLITKLAILLDPDKGDIVQKVFTSLKDYLEKTPERGKDIPIEIWVGSSHDLGGRVRRYIHMLYENDFNPSIPIVLFSGNPFQVSRNADALMYPDLLNCHSKAISLLALIGKAYFKSCKLLAKIFRQHFPVERRYGYFVLSRDSSVGRKLKATNYSQDEAFAIVQKKWRKKWSSLYLEGGSGARLSVSERKELIKKSLEFVHGKKRILYVGGGIRSVSAVQELCNIGVDVVVVSTVFEEAENPRKLIAEFIDAVITINKEKGIF